MECCGKARGPQILAKEGAGGAVQVGPCSCDAEMSVAAREGTRDLSAPQPSRQLHSPHPATAAATTAAAARPTWAAPLRGSGGGGRLSAEAAVGGGSDCKASRGDDPQQALTQNQASTAKIQSATRGRIGHPHRRWRLRGIKWGQPPRGLGRGPVRSALAHRGGAGAVHATGRARVTCILAPASRCRGLT